MDPFTLLNPSDPNPVRKSRDGVGAGPFVLVGDHAGAAIPRSLGDLGVSARDRARHIALDIGVVPLGEALSERLEVPFLSQAYSRLVADCNRDPADPEWAPTESDGTAIPGNLRLSETQRAARRDEIFEPYHRAIADLLDAREDARLDTVFVALHSFTPELGGELRPWDIGVLHDGHEDGFALAVLDRLRTRGELTIGDNQPYRMDSTDYTVPRHAYPRGLRYVELEVRQDRLSDARGVAQAARLLAEILPAALR